MSYPHEAPVHLAGSDQEVSVGRSVTHAHFLVASGWPTRAGDNRDRRN